jgi:hypothetical protein
MLSRCWGDETGFETEAIGGIEEEIWQIQPFGKPDIDGAVPGDRRPSARRRMQQSKTTMDWTRRDR